MNGSAKHVVGEKSNKAEDTSLHGIYSTINFTRYSVTEVGALSAAGWAWSARGRHTLRWEWAWLAGRGRCTASRREWQAGSNGSVTGITINFL